MNADLLNVLQAAFPGEEARYFLPMKIGGGDPAVAVESAAAILNGIKTTTSPPVWDYPDGRIPFAGALGVLLDGQNQPRAIVETYRVELIPFG